MRERRERERGGNKYYDHAKLSSYRILHDPVDELTARRRVGVHRIQGSRIAIPLFTNLMVNLHV